MTLRISVLSNFVRTSAQAAAAAGILAGTVSLLSAASLTSSPPANGLQAAQRPAQLDLSMEGRGNAQILGIAGFTAPAGDQELADALHLVASVLWDDIDFEHEYRQVSREAAAMVSTPASGPVPGTWVALGADLVLTGVARRVGQHLEVDVTVMAVTGSSAGEPVFGRRYRNCTLENPRACAHFIADDFHKAMTGLDGVAQARLAFVSTRDALRLAGRPVAEPGVSKEVYFADYDGANPRRITANRHLNIAPAWSPDGRSLAYTSWESGFQDIYVIHPFAGGPRSRLAAGSDHQHNELAEWSPDGTRLVFSSTDSRGYRDVVVVNRDGSGRRNLTPNTPTWDDGAPTWSPNGQQIAFTSNRSGTNQIYTMSADGTLVTRLTFGAHSDAPAWSSRGYIAFALQTSSAGQDIAVYVFQTQEVRVLTDGIGSYGSPSVAPNGRHIALTATRWGQEQIATIDYPTGTNLRRVTFEGANSYPSWSLTPGVQR